MFIHWSESMEIGDPVIDSEHRYLVQLINNLHEQFEAGQEGTSLAKLFTHLAKYVRVHFGNEETLMEAISFPRLAEHRVKHKELVEQTMELSEQYMEGEGYITEETIEFMKNWVLNHIAGSDMKIKEFFTGERPSSVTAIPAFAAKSGSDFKVCTFCGKSWQTFDDLKNDRGKVLKGLQRDLTNHLYNLIMFNCSCGTTLAMFIKEFVTQTNIPFEIEEHGGTGQRPAYCLKAEEDGLCLEKCACLYTRKVLKALGLLL